MGDFIEDPATGERIILVRTSAQTGVPAELDLELSPTARLPRSTFTSIRKRFELLSGHEMLKPRGKE